MQQVEPYTLTTTQTRAAFDASIAVLAASFQTAPNFIAAFPNARARQRALPHIFRLVIRDAGAFGEVTIAQQGDEVIGAALWYLPGQAKLSFRRQLQALPELIKTFAAAPTAFARFARLGGELEKRHPTQPHIYLSALGVSSAWRGQGVGSTLLSEGTARAEAQGLPCYLETFSEANVRFYRRHGFNVSGQGEGLIPDGPPFWFMTRPLGGKT